MLGNWLDRIMRVYLPVTNTRLYVTGISSSLARNEDTTNRHIQEMCLVRVQEINENNIEDCADTCNGY